LGKLSNNHIKKDNKNFSKVLAEPGHGYFWEWWHSVTQGLDNVECRQGMGLSLFKNKENKVAPV
jgi:hypothetical protein